MEPDEDTGSVTYVIPARTITGTVPRILDEIDDMIDGLQLVRAAVVARAPKAALPVREKWHVRLRRALGLTARAAHPRSDTLPTAR